MSVSGRILSRRRSTKKLGSDFAHTLSRRRSTKKVGSDYAHTLSRRRSTKKLGSDFERTLSRRRSTKKLGSDFEHTLSASVQLPQHVRASRRHLRRTSFFHFSAGCELRVAVAPTPPLVAQTGYRRRLLPYGTNRRLRPGGRGADVGCRLIVVAVAAVVL